MVFETPLGKINPAKIITDRLTKKKGPTPQEQCVAKGGTWDSVNAVCVFPEVKPLPKPVIPKVAPNTPETFTNVKTGIQSGIVDPLTGKTFLGLSPEDVNQIAQSRLEKTQQPEGTAPVGTAQDAANKQALGEQLSAQVGQTDPSIASPSSLDLGETVTSSLREAIPRALTLSGGAAVAGATAGLATAGAASIPLAVGAAAITFTGSISASMLSNMKRQRTDTTNAQQRVLDEGKQTLSDWSTLASADPSRKIEAVTQFNNQLQIIQDAHHQMLTDTNADVLKFENAIPNLAEFNSFYSVGGERDALVADMRNALTGVLNPDEVNFRMISLTNREGTAPTPPQPSSGGFLGEILP